MAVLFGVALFLSLSLRFQSPATPPAPRSTSPYARGGAIICGEHELPSFLKGGGVKEKSDITLCELALELEEKFSVNVHRWSIGRFLRELGYTHKKKQFLPKSSGEVM